jgi:hypothetical protein
MGLFNWGKAVKDAGEGVKSAFGGIGEGVGRIINSAKGQIPPEYQGKIEMLEIEIQGELKKAEIETGIRVKELMADAQQSVYDFALQYEGTAAQVPKWILVLRSVIRPVITICMFFSLMFFMGLDIKQIWSGEVDKLIMSSLPQAYWVILGIILGFWFGGKAGENIADKLKK